jgi:hypothetical protein
MYIKRKNTPVINMSPNDKAYICAKISIVAIRVITPNGKNAHISANPIVQIEVEAIFKNPIFELIIPNTAIPKANCNILII